MHTAQSVFLLLLRILDQIAINIVSYEIILIYCGFLHNFLGAAETDLNKKIEVQKTDLCFLVSFHELKVFHNW